MLISHHLLHLRFATQHFIGAGLCVIGIGVLVAVDWVSQGVGHGANNAPLGDVLVLLGASLYAISNVGQEVMVVKR